MFDAIIRDGRLTMPEPKARAKFKAWCVANDGARVSIDPVLPDSPKQRKFYHGAVLALWAYLDGKDYRSNRIRDELHEVAKLEFNGVMVAVGGKAVKIGGSTAGKLRDGFIDRVIDYLEEQYGIDREQLLNPAQYKLWKNTIFPYGGPDSYIGYLLELKLLK